MDDTIKFEMTKSEAEQLSASIESLLATMRKANEQIAKDEAEFNRLRRETEAIIRREWKAA